MRSLRQASRQFPCEPSSCLPTVFAAKKTVKTLGEVIVVVVVGGGIFMLRLLRS